jgi:hypothetical protein
VPSFPSAIGFAGNFPTREDEGTDVGTVWDAETALLELRNRFIDRGNDSSCLGIICLLEIAPPAVIEFLCRNRAERLPFIIESN